MKNYLLSSFIVLISIGVFSQDSPKSEAPANGEIATTSQSVKINGVTIPLTTRAGTMVVRDENNEPVALMGFTSYFKDGANTKRPIMFAYNGGPGSSSFWLHMGVLGPKRIVINDPGFTPASPYQLVNNEYSLLDLADLVMIDPVGTGLSVPTGKATFQDFWGVDQDAKSIAMFMRQFLTEYGRMNSPKFLLGESYGTFRNAVVMNRLLNQGIALNGVIMVSAVFDLRTLLFPPNDDLPYLVHFPTYAATAWYHKKIASRPDNLESFLAEVRQFTENEYAPALYKGDRLTSDEKNKLASRLERYAGVSTAFWLKADLRIEASEFYAELLREEGNVVGRLDSRFKGPAQDMIAQTADYDPQSLAISPAYITGFLDYFHNDLKVNKKLQYALTAGTRKGFKWDWSHEGNLRWGTSAAIHSGIDMAEALSHDPNMKVLILNGYYDVATVFYGVEHTIDHLGLPKRLKDNIIMKYYEAGHMMYTHQPSLEKFRKDVAQFIQDSTK